MQTSLKATPICRRITHDANSGRFGFEVDSKAAARNYQMMPVFETLQDAIDYIDPHQKRIWEAPSDADESCVLISRRYKPGAVTEQAWSGHTFLPSSVTEAKSREVGRYRGVVKISRRTGSKSLPRAANAEFIRHLHNLHSQRPAALQDGTRLKIQPSEWMGRTDQKATSCRLHRMGNRQREVRSSI